MRYNVVGGGDSALYGVEDRTYYLRNGFNNLNFAMLLALMGPALGLLQWSAPGASLHQACCPQHSFVPDPVAVQQPSHAPSHCLSSTAALLADDALAISSAQRIERGGTGRLALIYRMLGRHLPTVLTMWWADACDIADPVCHHDRARPDRLSAACCAGRKLAPRLIVALLPVGLWPAVLSALPHKEERFLYVTYPLVCSA